MLLETPAQVYAVSIAQLFQDDSTAFGPDLLDRLCYVTGALVKEPRHRRPRGSRS